MRDFFYIIQTHALDKEDIQKCFLLDIVQKWPGTPPPVLDTDQVTFACEGLKKHYLTTFGFGLDPPTFRTMSKRKQLFLGQLPLAGLYCIALLYLSFQN